MKKQTTHQLECQFKSLSLPIKHSKDTLTGDRWKGEANKRDETLDV